MIRIGLVGGSGRMGQSLKSLIQNSGEFKCSWEVGRSQKLSNMDASAVDGVIDFSTPELSASVIAWCCQNNLPLVIGTTGFAKSIDATLKSAGEKIPILWSPNMSLGVAFMQKAIEQFEMISNFDFQIEEVHHTQKKDAPSGTAILLQNKLQQAVGRTLPDVISIRAGKVFGIHRVYAFGGEETITLEHQALNRDVFSRGALTALKWLVQQRPGTYTLMDVFELK